MKTTIENNTLTIFLEGRIDTNNAAQTEKDIFAAVGDRKENIVIDAEALEYISSAGLRVLMKLRKTMKTPLPMINVSREIYDILETTGFTELLDVSKALRKLSIEGCEQIAAGGPVTITDRRIIRYFMTIPEASQLVLTSGAMARDGELYVLDMGKPVRILDLAENMIRLTGYEPYQDIDIVETGLRPGEKLYEELLVQDESLGKTENEKIFVEKDAPLGREEIERRLELLRDACRTGDDDRVREALREAVPTFRTPESVNSAGVKQC